VFELIPPAKGGGSWNESILWSFNGTDGGSPRASVIMDTSGNLYSTTHDGGTNSQGTAFELTPPSTIGGNWTESVLWSFGNVSVKDGAQPWDGLIMDNSGNFYGTTIFADQRGVIMGGGTVFEVSTRTVLAASPAKLNFGNVVAPGTSKPKKVTLTNKGTVGVGAQISTITATAPFTIAGGANTCSGQTIAPKKTCTFAVEFAPTTVANVTGSINVTYNGASPAVALGGNGIAAR
jgi:Abnormal spindle-like microcephaly-assoc'd, ASPM-SPD-2-Hydin